MPVSAGNFWELSIRIINGADVASNLALVLLFLLVFCLCGVSDARGPIRGRAVEKQMQLDDLQLSITEKIGQDLLDGGYTLKFSRQGRPVYTGDCAFRVHDPKIVSGVPQPNCGSLLTYCFSGGAHCCMSLIIATTCGSRTALDVIDMGHSGSEARFVDTGTAGQKAIRVTDWQFAYYSVEGTELGLSFADSPGMTRLLVFDGKKWRVDGVGEFSRFYDTLLREARHSALSVSRRGNGTEREAGAGISAAYYLMMSGKPLDEVSSELSRLLPLSWKPEADKIREDLKRAISEFNPVEVIE